VKGKLRYIAVAVCILVLILIALPFFISANVFRPALERHLSLALGRKVEVGNLSLSILSGALAAETFSISDDPSFNKSPFLTAESLKVNVELWPLITSKKLNITGVTIENPEVILLRNNQAQWNFSTLAAGASPPPTPATNPSHRSVDARDGTSPEFTVAKLELEKGRVTVGSTVADKTNVYDNVDLQATNLSLKSQFPVMLTGNLPGGGGFKADGGVGPIHQEDVSLSPLDMKVTITGLDLTKTDFVHSGAGLAGIMDIASTLQSNNGLARAQGSVNMRKLQLVKGGNASGLPVDVNFAIDYDLPKNAGVLNQGIVKIGTAVFHLSGTFDRRGESAVLDMKLDGQNLPVQDLQSALPAVGVILPNGSSLQAGTLSAQLNIQGPVEKLMITGSVGLFNATLAGFDTGSKMAALSALSGIQKSGGNTFIQKLTSVVRVTSEGIQLTNLELVMPAFGQLNGGGTISSSSALNLKMVATLSAQNGLASAVESMLGMSKNSHIPFLVLGTTTNPEFVPDVAGIVGGAIESEFEKTLGSDPRTKGLSDALGGLLGGKKGKSK
jgi:AsmA protein